MAPIKPQKKPKMKKRKQGLDEQQDETKRKRNVPLLGDDDDFGDFITTDDVHDTAAVAGDVQLDDEDVIDVAVTEPKSKKEAKQVAEAAKEKIKKKQQVANSEEDRPTDGDGTPVKKNKKVKKRAAADFEAQKAVSAEIADRHPAEQAAWLRDSWRTCSGASELELEVLSETSVVALSGEGTFEDRVRAAAGPCRPKLTGSGQPPGSPAALLVSSAAMGAIGLMKKLPNLNKECRIAKLFAKHFKVAEQEKLLESTVIGIASGTPNRLGKLADLAALKLDHLQLLILDVHLDAKQRTILDIPETRGDFWDFFAKHVSPGIAAGRTKLALVDGEKLQ